MSTLSTEQSELLAGVRLVALDVDGVLTDGRLIYAEVGETMRFDARDGIAVRWLLQAGVQLAWITGRGSHATARRARELGVEELHTRITDKTAALADVQERLDIPVSATASMGDDLPDLALAARSALFAAPADARPEVREAADLVTRAGGGAGAVRELAEHILRAKGEWEALLSRYRSK